jgi:hypothetical protein
MINLRADSSALFLFSFFASAHRFSQGRSKRGIASFFRKIDRLLCQKGKKSQLSHLQEDRVLSAVAVILGQLEKSPRKAIVLHRISSLPHLFLHWFLEYPC